MPLEDSSVPEVRTLMSGLRFGELPRWHDGRFWVSDWVAHELIAVDLEGTSEVVVRDPSIPLCFDFLPDGRLLIMSGRRFLRLEPDGSRATHADLTGLSEVGWNEIVVDGRANAYVNTAGFDLMAGADFVPGAIAVVTADGSARQVADGVAFPNGMAVTPDNLTLIVAELYGRRLTAFDIGADGGLSNRRMWADLGDGVPDGICLDADNAVGTATSPTSVACAFARAAKSCRRSIWIEAALPACSEAPTGEPCSWWRPSGVVPQA